MSANIWYIVSHCDNEGLRCEAFCLYVKSQGYCIDIVFVFYSVKCDWRSKQKRQANRYLCRLLFYRACNTLFYHLYLFFICSFLLHCCSHNFSLSLSLILHSFTFTLINREYQALPTPYQYSQIWTKNLRPSCNRMYAFFLIVNHHLVESKENKYRPSTATTILDILKVCFIIKFIRC